MKVISIHAHIIWAHNKIPVVSYGGAIIPRIIMLKGLPIRISYHASYGVEYHTGITAGIITGCKLWKVKS